MSFARKFLEEIESFDENLYPPKTQLAKGEEVLFGECPIEARKLWSFADHCDRSAKEMQVELEYTTDESSESAITARGRFAEMVRKGKIARSLFWAALEDHFHFWPDTRTLGIRTEWQVVVSNETEVQAFAVEMPEFLLNLLKRRLGGQS